jgi:flagellar basal body rod protein FlgG
MPLRSIVNTARALSFYTRRQEISAHNLANVATDGYKGDRITARQSPGGPWPVPAQTLDLQQGNLRQTGRTLDVALEGDGFLVVKTADGERLSRGGSFSLDAGGMLVDAHGDAVLGADGPIALSGREIQIAVDGTIVVDGEPAGKLRLVNVKDPTTLRKEGLGHFATSGTLEAGAPGRVRQGALEDANVDSITGLVDLLAIQRAWAANTEAMRAMDSVLATVTNDIGKT